MPNLECLISSTQQPAVQPVGIDENLTQVCSLGDVEVFLVGPERDAFEVVVDADSVIVRPKRSLSRRHTIRPAALFEHAGGYHDLTMVMGRLTFPNGSTQPIQYRPFTHDTHRRIRALFLPVETMPGDEWSVSATRWQNCRTLARALLATTVVPWNPLTDDEIDALVTFVEWGDVDLAEPIEGCLLHALTQWSCDRGAAVIEIGSFRGRSACMLALALTSAGSEHALVSIDPHQTYPCNHEHVRLALRQLGQEERLVQIQKGSNDVPAMLREGMASLIFIDGAHDYDQVVADFRNYRDLLAVGGCLIFHDYGYGSHIGRSDACPDVRRAVDDHVLMDGAFRPLLLAQSQFAFVKTG